MSVTPPRPRVAARALAAASLLCLLTACPSRPPPEPVRVGLILDQGVKPAEEAILASARLAVDQTNARGGLLVAGVRRSADLVVEPDGETAEGAAAAARKLINLEGVVALVGPNRSSRASAAAAVAEDAGVPLVSPGATHPAVTAGRRWAFRVGAVDPSQARVMARVAFEDLGARRAAVVYAAGRDYSTLLASAFREAFEGLGGEVVACEGFEPETSDFSAQLAAAGASEALYLPVTGDDALAVARQARTRGLAPVLLGCDSWNLDFVAAQQEFEGSLFVQHWHASLEGAPSAAYRDAYRAAVGRNPGSSMGPLAYDAVGLVLRAVELAGSVDPGAVREAFLAMGPYPGATGPIEFRDGGDPVKPLVVLGVAGGAVHLRRQVAP